MARKWINLAALSVAGKPDQRTDYERTVDNKHNQGRVRDRLGRMQGRPRKDERTDNRDEENDPDRQDDREDV